MAKFRHVHTSFWQDPKVLEELTPEDKYFYLYLLTNPNTTQIGVYQITKKQMSFDLGYSLESINSLLDRFINHHKIIKYNENTREIVIINWGKYNLNKAGKPVLDCIQKELREVKDQTLLLDVMKSIPNQTVLELFSRHVNGTSHDTLTKSGQKEKEKEKEKIVVVVNAHQFYQENFGVISPFVAESIQHWIDDIGDEMVIEAMKRALKQQKKWNYAEGILREWINSNIRSLQDIEAYETEFRKKKEVKNGEVHKHPRRVGRFTKESGKSYEQIMQELESDRKAWGG